MNEPIKEGGYQPYTNNADWDFLDALASGSGPDTQPDIYSFNVGGASGKFFLKKRPDGSFRAYTIPYQDVKIEVPANLAGGEWKITLPDGSQYLFGGVGFTESTDVTNESGPGSIQAEIYVSAWYVKKMISANGDDEISFVYQSATNKIDYQTQYSESKSYGLPGNNSGFCNTPNTYSISINSIGVIGRLHIKEIIGQTGHKIVFEEGASRLDYSDKVLGRIKVISNTGETVKTCEFFYQYLNMGKKFLQLQRIQEVSNLGTTDEKGAYEFKYFAEGLGTIDSTFSRSIDHWGYYNGANNTSLIPAFTSTDGSISYDGGNREVNTAKTKIGVMTEMRNPTGGKAIFDWEANTYQYTGCDGTLENRAIALQGQASFGQADAVKQIVQKKFVIDTIQYVRFTTTINTQGITDHECSVTLWMPQQGDSTGLIAYPGNISLAGDVYLQPGTYYIRAEAWVPPVALPDSQTEVSAYFKVEFSQKTLLGTEGCTKPGPGLRIAKVVMSDGLNKGNDLIKEYRYNQFNNPGASSGELPGDPPTYGRKGQYAAKNVHSVLGCLDVICQTFSLSSSSNASSGYTKGSPIGYREVAVLHGEAGINGYTQHEFSFVKDFGSLDNDWKRGHLLRQRTYDVRGRVLQASENFYSILGASADINYTHTYGVTAEWRKRSACLPDSRNTAFNLIIEKPITIISAWHRMDR
ncbi:hypothetical protein BKI52_37385 [marine bacterium AO1-C]|nr:hypothetical protein BKI52_37385 [marine bacterium AO1-C]